MTQQISFNQSGITEANKNIGNNGTIQERALYKTGELLLILAAIIIITIVMEYYKGRLFTYTAPIYVIYIAMNGIVGAWLGYCLKRDAKKAYINRRQSTYAMVEQQETEQQMAEEKAVHAQMKKDYPDMFK